MGAYLIKRLLLFVPTLVIISWVAFGLSLLAPGDPVMGLCADQGILIEGEYQRCARQYGYDLPPFYFSLSPAAYPDTLHRIQPQYRRHMLRDLIAQTGNWPDISVYDQQLEDVLKTAMTMPDSLNRQQKIDVNQTLRDLRVAFKPGQVDYLLARLDSMALFSAYSAYLTGKTGELLRQWDRIKMQATPTLLIQPDWKWYGTANRYHRWMAGLVTGDFGTSFKDKRPVGSKLRPALFWTLCLNLSAFALALLLAIPIGVYSALRKGGRMDRFFTVTLFGLYSLPRFWVATILVVFFTSTTYGGWLDWFPSIGLGTVAADASGWERFWVRASHMLLPVLCQTYGLLAFFARQMRGAMLEVIRQDYIRTARAKGLKEEVVVWRHAFRNALFPIITVLSALFPASIAGSVVLEVIFAIPGMGMLTYDAIFAADWPVVFSVLILGALLTMLGIWVSDLLYGIADPRIRLGRGDRN
ncbi:MAG: ABC transporter permease [Lewinellaceae bacterium]|nr:ABC transporter permease [Lewinellaceae bacterium]